MAADERTLAAVASDTCSSSGKKRAAACSHLSFSLAQPPWPSPPWPSPPWPRHPLAQRSPPCPGPRAWRRTWTGRSSPAGGGGGGWWLVAGGGWLVVGGGWWVVAGGKGGQLGQASWPSLAHAAASCWASLQPAPSAAGCIAQPGIGQAGQAWQQSRPPAARATTRSPAARSASARPRSASGWKSRRRWGAPPMGWQAQGWGGHSGGSSSGPMCCTCTPASVPIPTPAHLQPVHLGQRQLVQVAAVGGVAHEGDRHVAADGACGRWSGLKHVPLFWAVWPDAAHSCWHGDSLAAADPHAQPMLPARRA